MEKMSIIYEALLSMQADLVIGESLRRFEESRLYDDIDAALQVGDEETFLKLTERLKTLQRSHKQASGS